MRRKGRGPLLLAGLAVIFTVGWMFLPGPFGRGVLVGIFGGLGALVGGIAVFGRTMRKRLGGQLRPPPLPTGSWDYAMDLTQIDGTPAGLASMAGGVLVLNFWATWCAPCIAEMPSLRTLRERTADLDVRFALVTSEEGPTVRKFLEARDPGLPVYLLEGDRPECFQGRSIPATFIVDRTGRIVLRHFGAAAWDDEAVVAFVRGLAATPTG